MPNEKRKFVKIDFSLRKDRNDCIILASKELKNTLVSKCNELGITVNEVVAYHHDDIESFELRYIRRRNPKSGPRLSQAQLLKYLKFVGVKFNIVAVKGLEEDRERVEENARLVKDKRRDRSLRSKKK